MKNIKKGVSQKRINNPYKPSGRHAEMFETWNEERDKSPITIIALAAFGALMLIVSVMVIVVTLGVWLWN